MDPCWKTPCLVRVLVNTLATFWLFYDRTVLQNDGLPCFSIHFGNFGPKISAKCIARTACPGFLPSGTDETRKCSLLSILSLQKRGGVAQSNAGEPLGLARDDVLVIYWTDDEAELLFAFDSMLRTWESSPRVDCCDSGLHKVKVDICLSVRSHILASKFLKLKRVTLISML